MEQIVFPLYDVRMLSLDLNLKPAAVRRLIRSGELKSLLLAKEYRVPANALEEFLESRMGMRSRAGRPRKHKGNNGGSRRNSVNW